MIRLSKPVSGGTQSRLSHLEAVWKATGTKPQELADLPDPPEELMYLWHWLGDQVHPMSYAELEGWARLTGRSLSRWEVEALIQLDRARANV